MEIKALNTTDNVTEYIATGRLDATTAPSFEEQVVIPAEGEITGLLVNLSELEYISSAGLRSVLKLAKLCKSKSVKLALFGLNPNVAQVFKISGFTMILTICDDKEQALAKVQS